MSTTFWYHPESECYYTTDGIDPTDLQHSIQLEENEWSEVQISRALESGNLPDGITAIMVEASKTLAFGSGKDVIFGKIYLRAGIPNGTECTTTPVEETLPGNRVRTKNTTYLVRWSKAQQAKNASNVENTYG